MSPSKIFAVHDKNPLVHCVAGMKKPDLLKIGLSYLITILSGSGFFTVPEKQCDAV
jgi:hypothetical protein